MWRKLVFSFFLVLPLLGSSQIIYRNSIDVDGRGKKLDLSIFQEDGSYVFEFSFTNFESCQNNSKLFILSEKSKVQKYNSYILFGCERKYVYFDVDTSKINPEQIKKVRYYNSRTAEYYDFEFSKKKENIMIENHDLHHEFPEFEQKIHDLKVSDSHFRKLFDMYHEVDKKIHGVEATQIYTDEELNEMRSKRANLKDLLYEILKKS